jgi:hypothetical protein
MSECCNFDSAGISPTVVKEFLGRLMILIGSENHRDCTTDDGSLLGIVRASKMLVWIFVDSAALFKVENCT